MQPNDEELDKVYTTMLEDETKCYGLNQWMPWNSVGNPSRANGNDCETLDDHRAAFQ